MNAMFSPVASSWKVVNQIISNLIMPMRQSPILYEKKVSTSTRFEALAIHLACPNKLHSYWFFVKKIGLYTFCEARVTYMLHSFCALYPYIKSTDFSGNVKRTFIASNRRLIKPICSYI